MKQLWTIYKVRMPGRYTLTKFLKGGLLSGYKCYLRFFKDNFSFCTGRVCFVKSDIGKQFNEYDQVFTVFRRVQIKTFIKKSNPEAIFKIRFKPANMGIEQNKRFSYLPMLVFMGFEGFRSKYWAVNEDTGLCIGVYEWDTVEDAKNYSKSIAVRFMNKLSVTGSVEFQVIPKKNTI